MARVALISDVHANLPALEAVLADAKNRGYDVLFNAGDIVGYGPWPVECMDLVLPVAQKNVMGNHDVAVARPEVLGHFNPVAAMAARWTTRTVDDADKLDALDALPLSAECTELGIALYHGFPGRVYTDSWREAFSVINTYLRYPQEAEAALKAMTNKWVQHPDARIVVVGHDHVAKYLTEASMDFFGEGKTPDTELVKSYDPDEPLLVCPGSVGQPRDKDPRASYALLDTDAHEVTYVKVSYDVEPVQERLRQTTAEMIEKATDASTTQQNIDWWTQGMNFLIERYASGN